MMPSKLRPLMLSLLLAGSTPALGSCPIASTTMDLMELLEGAESAYSQLDLDGFIVSSNEIRSTQVCLGEALTRPIAARIHRAEGLRFFLDQEQDRATKAFAAARSIEPGYVFPQTLVPQGYPELDAYHALSLQEGSSFPVPEPAEGYLVFDSRPGVERPVSWPTILQRVDGSGVVVHTQYLWPFDTMPEYPLRPDPPPEPEPIAVTHTTPIAEPSTAAVPAPPPSTTTVTPEPGNSTALAATTVILTLASGTAYGIARNASSLYYDTETPYNDLDAHRALANRATVVSGATGLVALTTGAIWVVRW